MTVKELLERFAGCKTYKEAKEVSDGMIAEFSARSSRIGHLQTANENVDNSVTEIDFNRVLSNYYITTIKVVIEYGEFSVWVSTNHLRDGHGLDSQDCQVVMVDGKYLEDGGYLEENLHISAEETLLNIAQRAATIAIRQHQILIEQVGIPQAMAVDLAQSCWASERGSLDDEDTNMPAASPA